MFNHFYSQPNLLIFINIIGFVIIIIIILLIKIIYFNQIFNDFNH